MTLTAYSHLKDYLIINVGSNERHKELLNSLKELFRESINSVRRFEQIKSIGDLLKILEIRDVLSEDNVEALKDIARKLPDRDEVLKRIIEYEETHVPRKVENYYLTKPVVGKQQRNYMDERCTTSSPLQDIMNNIKKKQRIFETVTEEIGTFWRDLGRNLKVRECVIDDIDFQNRQLEVKATKLLEVFDSKADRQKWFYVLCNALEKSRRRDLVQSIQEIMTMNI